MSIHFHHDDFFPSRRSGPSPNNEFPLLIATNSRERDRGVLYKAVSLCAQSVSVVCASEHTRVVCSPVMSSVLCTRARFHLLAHIATHIIALRSCSRTDLVLARKENRLYPETCTLRPRGHKIFLIPPNLPRDEPRLYIRSLSHQLSDIREVTRGKVTDERKLWPSRTFSLCVCSLFRAFHFRPRLDTLVPCSESSLPYFSLQRIFIPCTSSKEILALII
jgi:hypothetical protein